MRQRKAAQAVDGMVSQPSGAPSATMLGDLAGSLDRALPVPLGTQLRGLIEFGIALGELPAGQRLPSVRELAERANIAPMTVSIACCVKPKRSAWRRHWWPRWSTRRWRAVDRPPVRCGW